MHETCQASASEPGVARAVPPEPGRGGWGAMASRERSEPDAAPQGRTSRREAA